MKHGIEQFNKLAAFSDIDRHMAEYLSTFNSTESPIFYLAVMLLSRSVSSGDVCLGLDRIAGQSLQHLSADDPDNAEIYSEIVLPQLGELTSCINASRACGSDGDRLPLILCGSRLYFNRQLAYENELAAMIKSMCVDAGDLPAEDELVKIIAAYFPSTGSEPDMQGVAAAVSLKRRLSVISGGPGTGKTSTVVKILGVLKEARALHGLETRVALAAPTGKAAARLASAASTAGEGAVPSFTLHRLLGYSGTSGFRRSAESPLDYDVVVADECSMADLPLMHSFISALKTGSRLILLGDKDQLASVEGGAVFGDICATQAGGYSSSMAQWCSKITGVQVAAQKDEPGIWDSITFLSKSWRFGETSGIGSLAAAVRRGDEDEVISILSSGNYPDLCWIRDVGSSPIASVINSAASQHVAAGMTGHEAVRPFINRFCILTATRRGQYGMEKMNLLAERVLSSSGIIDPSAPFYEGRPVMVTGNDYNLRLFNGDIGVVSHERGGASVLFSREGEEERAVSCSRLPVHETAFAMTIHKSQGSEFGHVLVVLPQQWNRIMTRELLYTALTRGRNMVTIAGDEEVIRKTVVTGLERMSGLREKLHGGE